jgi:hypothetical protein
MTLAKQIAGAVAEAAFRILGGAALRVAEVCGRGMLAAARWGRTT